MRSLFSFSTTQTEKKFAEKNWWIKLVKTSDDEFVKSLLCSPCLLETLFSLRAFIQLNMKLAASAAPLFTNFSPPDIFTNKQAVAI